MSKYRIKKEIAKNGSECFYVQKKILFIWYDITQMIGFDAYRYIAYDNLDKACNYINERLQNEIRIENSKILKTEIIQCNKLKK